MRTNKRVGAIIRKENTVLLIHRYKNGQEYWVLPGGGVEDEETLEQALRREVIEETSLELVKYELVGQAEDETTLHYFYNCVLTPGEPAIGGPEKADSSEKNVYILEWVNKNCVADLNLYPAAVKAFITANAE